MKNISTNCQIYGWTNENIKLSKVMVGHIMHHINNDLAPIILSAGMLPDGRQKDQILKSADRINEYVKWLESRIEET